MLVPIFGLHVLSLLLLSVLCVLDKGPSLILFFASVEDSIYVYLPLGDSILIDTDTLLAHLFSCVNNGDVSKLYSCLLH